MGLKVCRCKNKDAPFQGEKQTTTGRYSPTERALYVQRWRGNPHTVCPLMRRSEAKQCCFKPHAVKVVYLLVIRDVTTHPCLRGRVSTLWAPELTKQCSKRQNSHQSQTGTGHTDMSLAAGGAGGKSLFPVEILKRGRCITKTNGHPFGS